MFFGCERRETSRGSGPDRAHHAVPHSRQKRHNQRCCRSLLSSSTLSSTVHVARGGAYHTRPCFFSNQILNLLSLFHIECFFFHFFSATRLGQTLTFVILFYFLDRFLPFCYYSLGVIFVCFLFPLLFIKLLLSLLVFMRLWFYETLILCLVDEKVE